MLHKSVCPTKHRNISKSYDRINQNIFWNADYNGHPKISQDLNVLAGSESDTKHV